MIQEQPSVNSIIGAVAELERENINERVREGVAIAKAEGKYKGRKKGSIELKGDSLNRFKMFYNKGFNKTELSKEFGVPRATIYRWEKVLKKEGSYKNEYGISSGKLPITTLSIL